MYFPLKMPPGFARPGTVYDAKGRWYDGNLVRWYEGTLQPIGGWTAVSSMTAGDEVRGAIAFRAYDTIWYAYGTAANVFLYQGGTEVDVTPTGTFNAGTQWIFDNFGEELLGIATSEGTLPGSESQGSVYTWEFSAGIGTVVEGELSGVTGRALVVTPERFVFVLAADDDPRLVRWADQESYDFTATASATNQVGEFPLATPGEIMCGLRSQGETLIFTDHDLWAARYIGGTLVYSFIRVGAQCGIIARRAATSLDTRTYWMGQRSFYMYDGFERELPCEVADYVFTNINRTHQHKVCCGAWDRTVWWFYPHGANTENSHYVAYHEDGHWLIGALPRSSCINPGPHTYPILFDNNGVGYEHETGTTYQDSGGTALVPNISSGPVELGNGDFVMTAVQLVPDEKTSGQVTATFYGAMYPNGSETTYGPYTLSSKTDVRFTARQVRMKYTQVTAGWRVGTPRLDLRPGGKR